MSEDAHAPEPIATAPPRVLTEGLHTWLYRLRHGPAPYHPPADLCERVLGAVEALAGHAFGSRPWGAYARIDDANADDAFARVAALCVEALKDPHHAPLNDVGMPGSDAARASLASLLPPLSEAWSTGRKALRDYRAAWDRAEAERRALSASVAKYLRRST